MSIENNSYYPLITVLICIYNKFQYLKRTIDSVLQQNYPYIELILADDASKNFPKNEIEMYIYNHKRENIVSSFVYTNSINLGTVKNINNRLKRAFGKYIIILGGDDEFYDSITLSKIVEEAERRKCGLLITSRLVSDENLTPLYFLPHRKSVKKILEFDTNMKQYERFISSMDYNMASGSAFCLNRNIFEVLGRYDEKYCLWEDAPFLEKYLWNYKVEFAYNLISIRYRIGGISDKKIVNPVFKNDEELYRSTDRIKHFDKISRSTKIYIKMSDLLYHKKRLKVLIFAMIHPICFVKKLQYRIVLEIYKKIDIKNINEELKKYASDKIHVSTARR